MNKTPIRFFILTFSSLLVWGMSSQLQSSPVLAHTSTNGYSIVLTQNAAISMYGNSAQFRATLTYPSSSPRPDEAQFQLFIDNQSVIIDSYGGSGNTLTLFAYSSGTLPAGQHTVVATYFIATTQTTIRSNVLTHTVARANAALSCSGVSNEVYSPGQSLTVAMQLTSTNLSSDPPGTTFSITFVGPTTTSFPHMKANSHDTFTVKVPPTVGIYKMECQFDGTTNFSPVGFNLGVVVSSEKATGAIQLYTNPTTITKGVPVLYYIVVPAAPGLPTPTGSIALTIGDQFTDFIRLNPDGTLLLRGKANFTLTSNTLYIDYSGDPTYNSERVSFPLTNPPIPGQNRTPTPSPSGTPAATMVPAGTPTRTVTGVPGTTGTPAVGTSTLTPGNDANSRSNASSPGVWMLLIVGLLILLGGAGIAGFFYTRSRGVRLTR